jgi:hypothetical protein
MKAKKIIRIFIYGLLFLSAVAALIYYTLPVNRINMHSKLIMLGDFNSDNKWDAKDASLLSKLIENPFQSPDFYAYKADVNYNGLLDDEDIVFLKTLYKKGDPYKARAGSLKKGIIFPYPREFFRYVPESEYIQRPVVFIKHKTENLSPLSFLKEIRLAVASGYKAQLRSEIYSEGLRFSLAYAKRAPGLLAKEKEYSSAKIKYCAGLWKAGREYELLLELIGLTEDAETLTAIGQPDFVGHSLYFRDHLRDLLKSQLYKKYLEGKAKPEEIFKVIEKYLLEDMNMTVDIKKLPPPQDYSKFENYVERAKWQYYKSSSNKEDFRRLLMFAQYNRRYLRAVARTTRKLTDIPLENHNLPMVLLFREALSIKGGSKMGAVGMIDEAVRIPLAWLKAMPRKMLPTSVALENFLLPGNKEDGSDKSRHWNVFGGISLYRSPEESLKLALAREAKDFMKGEQSPHEMTEFIRDTMANLNGIYYVVSINPDLLKK